MSLNLHTLIIFLTFFFFFNDTATTEIYTLSLHDALPISLADVRTDREVWMQYNSFMRGLGDRKSTRLNSSHTVISYAVFCLKKKKIGCTTYRDTSCCNKILPTCEPSPYV